MTPPLSTTDPAGLLGRTLDGRYHAVAFVGEGELGYVYRGEQTALRRACALKVLRPEVQRDAARLQRVMEGSQRVARGRFDALVPADDVLTTADRTTLVMPWLLGEDLGSALREAGRMSWTRTRELLLQLGEALAHLHSTGLVFAGLKPSNVFLVRSGEGDTVRLLDVGLSLHDAATANITYMAPEWVVGGQPDARTDVYNLAALAYEALTGVPAFAGPPAQVALLKRVKPPPPLRSVAQDLVLPEPVEGLLHRALERDPRSRPDMSTFLAVLRSTIPINEDGATRFFPRITVPPQRRSQSGELFDDEHHATGMFQRIKAPAPATRTLDLSPAEATRISSASVAPPASPPEERTQISNPIVHAPEDRTAISAKPTPSPAPPRVAPSSAPMPEQTRVAVAPAPQRPPEPQPPRSLHRSEPQAPPLAEWGPTPRPFKPNPAAAPAVAPPLERTVFLQPIDAATQRLSIDHPGNPPASRQPAVHTTQTSRTALIPGFGGSVLGDSPGPAEIAAIAVQGAPPRQWAWWSRISKRLRPADDQPHKPGLWARLRGVRVGNLPARRGPTGMDRVFRKLAEVPSYIGRGWRLLYRPFGRLIALRSKLSTPLMSLRTSFGRLARVFSRWTGGGA